MNKKERKQDPSHFDQEATFFPQLVSNDVLRDTVRSSGYGYVLPGGEEEDYQGPDSTRLILEEMNAKLTFKPDMMKSPLGKQLKATVPSSGYGKRRIQKQKTENTQHDSSDLFKPRLVTAKQSRDNVPSSGYGRKTVKKFPKTTLVQQEKPLFQPNIKTSKKAEELRNVANSTGYGRKIPRVPSHKQARPRTGTKPIPRTVFIGHDDEIPVKEDIIIKRATSDPYDDFVLDGVRIAHTSYVDQKYLECKSPIKEVPDVVAPAMNSTAQFQDISSSGYGVKSVPVSVAPTRDDDGRDRTGDWRLFKQGRIGDIDEDESEETLWRSRLKLSGHLRDVPSSGYGDKLPEKYVCEKKEGIITGSFAVPTGTNGEFPQPPPAKINHMLNNKVGSYGYGVVSPAVVPKKEAPPSMVWVPPSSHPALPKPDVPDRNRATDMVASHYGHDYDPALDGMYLMDAEEDGDEEENDEEEEYEEEEEEEEEPI